jgi:Mn2+/Fe2+ NRAMP family transporter
MTWPAEGQRRDENSRSLRTETVCVRWVIRDLNVLHTVFDNFVACIVLLCRILAFYKTSSRATHLFRVLTI